MAAIITYAEHRDGKLRRPSLEAVSEAKRLAGPLNATVEAVLVGENVKGLADELAAYGADKVHVVEGSSVKTYATESYARAVAAVVRETSPVAVLVPFTSQGKDVAPRIAARVGAGLVSDVVSFTVKDGKLEARRPMYAGKAYATVRWTGGTQMATLRPNVFALGEKADGKKAEVVTRDPEPDARARVVEVKAAEGSKIELTEAQIVVSGGRGLKGPENFHIVQSLADAFGAAMGASRAVVDAGWVDHHFQVGQTGKTVSPTLYIAAGISGAIQHLAGMSSSKVIVAINKDADAPIFKVANYGIVGDVFEVVPKLTEAAKAWFSSRH
jgi:electron transfer flavoprotein alpha subunit